MKESVDSLRPFFEPRSVAIIGATQKLGFGYGQTKALLSQGFGERLFFVNPSEKELYGKKVYGTISEIPFPVDLALVIVPARSCPEIVARCAEKGVKAAIVLAAGFSETGEDGRRIEEDMAKISRKKGIRLMGPNCIGVVNTERGFSTTELMEEAMRPGHIGIIAQSGVFGNILLDWAPEQGIRFSKVATIGNRCDVDEVDIVRYLSEDEQTRVIAIYLEGFRDARSAIGELRKASRKKPILVLKSGRTPPGMEATLSHTGTIAGNDEIYTFAFHQSGVFRFYDLYELFDVAKAFASQPLPSGKRLGVVTTSGSLGAMTADICHNLGLEMAKFSEDTLRGISSIAPPWMNVKNPLDLGPSGLMRDGMKWVIKDPLVDGVIGIFVIPYMVVKEVERLHGTYDLFFGPMKEIQHLREKSHCPEKGKPILFSTLGNSSFRKLLQDILGDAIPLMSSPENAAKAFWALYQYGLYLDKSNL